MEEGREEKPESLNKRNRPHSKKKTEAMKVRTGEPEEESQDGSMDASPSPTKMKKKKIAANRSNEDKKLLLSKISKGKQENKRKKESSDDVKKGSPAKKSTKREDDPSDEQEPPKQTKRTSSSMRAKEKTLDPPDGDDSSDDDYEGYKPGTNRRTEEPTGTIWDSYSSPTHLVITMAERSGGGSNGSSRTPNQGLGF
jgi:hypothetical protein